MVRSATELTVDEVRILRAADEIGFGELIEVEIDVMPKSITMDITPSQARFIAIVRDGLSLINKIIVHNHEPVLMEVIGEKHKIKYVRRFKV
jgi:hypothetical protein